MLRIIIFTFTTRFFCFFCFFLLIFYIPTQIYFLLRIRMSWWCFKNIYLRALLTSASFSTPIRILIWVWFRRMALFNVYNLYFILFVFCAFVWAFTFFLIGWFEFTWFFLEFIFLFFLRTSPNAGSIVAWNNILVRL